MKKGRRSRIWLWILLLAILAAVGYYLYTRLEEKPKEESVSQEEPSTPTSPPAPKPSIIGEEQIQPRTEPAPITEPAAEEPPEPSGSEEEVDCDRLEENLIDFFQYLDKQAYVQQLDLNIDTKERFQEILKKLVERPPVPAGEGVDHRLMIGNLYHLFRTLSRDDIRLIQTVIEHEQEALEINLMHFYRWLIVGEKCPDPEKMRAPFQVLYTYAGFFLNTTGGRAYLYRRPTGLRLLLSYYCVLILHEADQRGMNTYGIDTAGFIGPLRDELIHYPDLQFQRDYVERLSRMQDYYLHKR